MKLFSRKKATNSAEDGSDSGQPSSSIRRFGRSGKTKETPSSITTSAQTSEPRTSLGPPFASVQNKPAVPPVGDGAEDVDSLAASSSDESGKSSDVFQLNTNGYKQAILTGVKDAISTNRNPPPNPKLKEAGVQLAKAIDDLKQVCENSKSIGRAPLRFDNTWAREFILQIRESKSTEGDFAEAIQKAVKDKSNQNETAIPGQIRNVLQKVAPIAEVALSVGEYLDDVRE